ncbi:polysaccharide deacetylase family sporulation protein PdaB [Hathewaya histolytica]|uniref:polysaccharide deacetylase family sporulation protein PdaB n=1 Tax=Hathewaya histolytica TaxID=1498 RepID=UPI003B67AFC8
MLKFKKKHTISIGISLLIVVLLALGFNNKNIISTISKNKKIPIYSVDTKDKKVAISFDVNWGEDNTPKILDILDKRKVKCSFFLMGGWVEKYPDKVKSIHERGHEIGNHSNNHPDMTKVSNEKIINEIAVTDAKIMSITGEKPKLFRFPSGAYNDKATECVESTNHIPIQWDVDSIDWKEQGAKVEYERVIKKTKPGSILLFHNNAKYTPDNLDKIIEKLKSEGYTFVNISELIYKDNYEIDSTGRQIKK